MNPPEYEDLMRRAKIQYLDIPASFIENIVKDYTLRPEYYDNIYSGNVNLGKPKERDTLDDIKNVQYINIDDISNIN